MAGRRNARPLLLFLLVAICGVSVALSMYPSSGADATVTGLIATARLSESGPLQLTLRNASSKVVTAYLLRWPGGEDPEERIQFLLPSAGMRGRLPAGGVISLDDPFGPTRPIDVKVVSVIYDDNSWEGEARFAQGIFLGRRYHATALEKLELPILKSGEDISKMAERMRSAAVNAQASRNLEELNAAQYLRAAVATLDSLKSLSPDDAKRELQRFVIQEETLLHIIKAHSAPIQHD
jgi:hypothetical protein